MDATIDMDVRPAAAGSRRRYHLLVGPNGWLGDDWFADIGSAVEQAHAIEESRGEPGAGWQVRDLDATVVASSEQEAAEANLKVALLFLLPVLAALGTLAAYLALAAPAGL